MAILALCTTVAAFVVAKAMPGMYQADRAISGLLSAAIATSCFLLVHLMRLDCMPRPPPRLPRACCYVSQATLLLVVLVISLWHLTALHQGSVLTPLGTIITTKDSANGDREVHLLCDPGDGSSGLTKPTVVFLHGFSGSSMDAARVRRDPVYTATPWPGLITC
jgi:hypothetical protein